MNTNQNAGPPAPRFAAFNRVGQVSGPSGGGSYFRDGRYLVVLERITAGQSKKGQGEYAAVECTIAEVTTAFPAAGDFKGSNKEGERVSTAYMFSKHGDVAVSNFRGMIGAATDLDPNATMPGAPGYADPAAWERMCYKALEKDGKALAGAVLDVTAITVRTKAGGSFTKTVWSAVDPETEKRILAKFSQR